MTDIDFKDLDGMRAKAADWDSLDDDTRLNLGRALRLAGEVGMIDVDETPEIRRAAEYGEDPTNG